LLTPGIVALVIWMCQAVHGNHSADHSMTALEHALDRLVTGNDLDSGEAYAAFSAIMEGRASEAETAALLTGLRVKGESIGEIVGAARAMHERATPIHTKHP